MNWIPVSERLPEREKAWGKPMIWSNPVLVSFHSGQQAVARHVCAHGKHSEFWACAFFHTVFPSIPAYWATLPEGPQ